MISRERTDRGGFLCDEMGLGKTIQILSLVRNMGGRTLVVCPKSVVHQWEKESERVGIPITVTTYQRAEKFMGTYWHRLVLDEAHEVRNVKSKTHRRIKCIEYQKAWIVTGTPVYNSIMDFASLSSFLGFTQLDIQRDDEEIRKQIVLRRTKADFCPLPECHIETIDVPLGKDEETLYTNLYAKYCSRAKSLSAQDTMEILEMFLRMRQFMILPSMVPDVECFEGSSKITALLRMIDEHPTEKSLVFTQFHAESDFIQKDRKSTRLNSSHVSESRMPSSA